MWVTVQKLFLQQNSKLSLFFPSTFALPRGLSPRSQSHTHNVEVCQHVSLCVLLVNLLNIRSDHHEQLQMCDIVRRSWSAESLTGCYIRQKGEMIKCSYRTYRKYITRYECLALRQTYPRPPRKNPEERRSSFGWRHDGKSWGENTDKRFRQLWICVDTFRLETFTRNECSFVRWLSSECGLKDSAVVPCALADFHNKQFKRVQCTLQKH